MSKQQRSTRQLNRTSVSLIGRAAARSSIGFIAALAMHGCSNGSLALPIDDAQGTVSLLAGSTGGAGNLDGVSSAARFNGPSGLALSPSGDLYVSDTFNSLIRKVSPTGVVSTVVGRKQPESANGRADQATLTLPADVAFDSAGNLFVVEAQSSVRKVALDGSMAAVTRVDGLPGTPQSIAVDGLGNLYVSDLGGRIHKIDRSGTVTRFAQRDPAPTISELEQLSIPHDMAVDSAGDIYVSAAVLRSNRLAGALQKITPAGATSTLLELSGAEGQPPKIAVDAAGNVYLANPTRSVIEKVSRDGRRTVLAGRLGDQASRDGSGSNARFYLPNAIAVTPDGNTIYVGEASHTIRRIDGNRNVTTLAGLAKPPDLMFGPYHATDRAGQVYYAERTRVGLEDWAIRRVAPDGRVVTLVASGLRNPQGMVVDGTGNLYVADIVQGITGCRTCGTNAVVRRVAPDGRMTLFAGSLGPAAAALPDTDETSSKATLQSPAGLAIDRHGNLYLGQTFGAPLLKIATDGAVTNLPVELPSVAFAPAGVAVDPAGNVFVSVCPTNASPAPLPDGMVGPASLPPRVAAMPVGPRFDGGAIVRIDAAGAATVLAGSLTEAGFADGPGSQARFSGDRNRRECATGIALDAAGNVLVADQGNDAIRKVTADGIVSTVAGQSGKRGITLGKLPTTLSAPTDVSVDAAGNLVVGSGQAVLRIKF